MRSIFGALARPSMRSTTRLSFTSAIVGTVCTRKRSASSGSWSMSTAVTRSRSRSLRARCAIRLSMRRAGPERLAPKKTSRGRRSSPIGSHIPLQSRYKPRQRRALYTPGKDVGSLPDRSRARRRAWGGDAAGRAARPAQEPLVPRRDPGVCGRGGARVPGRRVVRRPGRCARGGGRVRDRRDARRGDAAPRRDARRDPAARRARRGRARRARVHPVRRLPRGTRAAGIGRSRAPPSPRALRRAAQPRARLVVVPERKKLILVVIDGLTPDVFEDAVDTGAAPALSFLAANGRYGRGVSTFPSLTPVCLSSIATGAHPDVHRIPHLVWYHRGERRIIEYGSSFAALRAAGMTRAILDTIINMNRQHLAADCVTVFEALEDASLTTAAINITCYRGRTPHLPTLPGIPIPAYGPKRFFFYNLFESDVTGAPLAVFGRSAGSIDGYAAAVGRWLVTRDGFDFLAYYLPDYDFASH